MSYCSIVLVAYLNCIAQHNNLNQQQLNQLKEPNKPEQDFSIEVYTPREFENDETFTGLFGFDIKK
jgi:hypothetical protein